MGTGQPGGDYTIFGPAWGTLATQASGVSMVYQASGGATSDILLIEQNAAQLGMTTLSIASQAWSGSASWTGGANLRGFRALFPMYVSTVQIIAPHNKALIRAADLQGAVIGVGPQGSSAASILPRALAALGIVPAGFRAGGYIEQINQMSAGDLTACAFVGATPVPAIVSAARLAGFNLIGFNDQQAALMIKAVPGLMAAIIPQNSLPGQSAAVATIGTGNIAIGRADLPAGLVSALTLAAMKHRAALDRVIPGNGLIQPAQLLEGDSQIMLHEGAVQALQSLGITVPDRLTKS